MHPEYTTYNDGELVEFLKQGNEGAFKEIYTRYWEKLFVTANFRLGSAEESEELVQDVLFKLWRRRETLELTYSLATYLAVAVKYEVINRLARRHKAPVVMAEDNMLSVADTSTEEKLSLTELENRLSKLVKQLPEKCRLVFTLSRDKNLSHKEIASELNISENTVEYHIKHALKHLKTGLQHLLFSLF